MSAESMLQGEDEFADRDSMGLQPHTEKTQTEEQATKGYVKMLLVFIPLIGQLLAWSTYFCASTLLGKKQAYDKKFQFIHDYELGYIFLSVYIIAFTRSCLVINANGARAPARVDRPDQHVYKIMAASGPLKDAPYVMMATTGPQGRFNRAHRGVFNTDEALPLFLTNTLLAGSVFGPIIACLVLLVAYGRVTFGLKYKNSAKERGAGFLPAVIGEKWTEAFVLLCAIKGIFFTSIPF